jgi:acetyl esterase/lipase
MPSLRARVVRFLIKHLVARKFRRADRAVAEYRKLDSLIIKSQRVPAGTEVSPISINGISAEWVGAAGARTDCAIIYLHGGAFIMGSPATHRELAARLADATGIRVLVLDYRLAPEHPFPAAMQDAVSAYRWLLEQGLAAKRVAMGGDSAGGGLALQTLLALRDEGSPLPAAAFLLSPPTDWVRLDGESYSNRAHLDPLNTLDMCRYTASLYVGESDPDSPLLRPLDADLSGLPPLCIHVGDHEVLLSDSVRLAERARASNVDVDLKIWPGMWHVFQSTASVVPEARQSIDEVGRFIQNHIG